MAKWVYRLNVNDLWDKHNAGKLNTREVAKEVAKRIRLLPCYEKYQEDLEEIVLDFINCEDNIFAFDEILSRLYDWADMPLPTPKGEMQRKMCWVSTF